MSGQQEFSDVLSEWSELFMQNSFHAFKQFMDQAGLSHSQISTLMRLYHGKPCQVSEVGSHVGVTNAAASQLVDKLVQMELVERSEDPADRRTRNLRLTDKGCSLMRQAFDARKRWLEQLIATLPAEKHNLILEGIREINNAARSLSGANDSPADQDINQPR